MLTWKFFIISLVVTVFDHAAFARGLSQLSGHIPFSQVVRAHHLGRHLASSRMKLAASLILKDQAGLTDLLTRLYDPSDPLYHQFITPSQFVERFAPAQEDVDQLVQYLTSQGLTVTNVHSNRLMVDFEASSGKVEDVFQLELHDYLAADGNIDYSPTTDPIISDEVSEKLIGISGLSNFSRQKNHLVKSLQASSFRPSSGFATAHATVSDYMTPAKIKSAYNLNSLSLTGSGETLALFELDGYTATDISGYATYFSMTAPTLQNVLVDGVTNTAGVGANEVTLDIELVLAVAPGLSKIMVYEGPNSWTGVLDTYSRIASDNTAKVVSTSWGTSESSVTTSEFNSENVVFQQMASQGQSVFAASGDSGAYDDSLNPTTLTVDDPASQPYVTGVGGTTLTLNGSNGYSSEKTWGYSGAGGGGGISSHWSIPSWQSGLGNSNNLGSSTMRMVPDVSLDADPSSGYSIYYTDVYGGQTSAHWYVFGGTSAAAPLWAAFTALINQQRVTNSLGRVGYFNPAIYAVGQNSTAFANGIHDIADGSTNLYFPAVSGYDLGTGWGSFNGANLLPYFLAPSAPTPLILTAGHTSAIASWAAGIGATSYILLRSTSLAGTYSTVVSGLTSSSYTDTGLVSGLTYYYYVQSVNSAGTSSASSIQSVVPLEPLPVPSAPTNLTVKVIQ